MADPALFLGLLVYAAVAAAVAALCYRIWRFGKLPEFVAAAISTLVALVIIHAATGDTYTFDPFEMSIFFAVAWMSAHCVQLVTQRIRELNE